MGLDMYLIKTKKVNDCNIDDFYATDDFVNWKEKGAEYTLKEWCGRDSIDKEKVNRLIPLVKTTYYNWDVEKRHPHMSCIEHVGYWRKANEIHNWFVENIQDGTDDCGTYPVEKEDLEDLLDLCKEVLSGCIFTYGKVESGVQFNKDGVTRLYENDKRIILNPELPDSLLPTTNGFFFGNTGYNEWYLQDIEETIDILEKVLKETDFENEQVYYSSSW